MEVSANDEEDTWSSRLKFVRKGTECVFGRVKGWFRLFKTSSWFSTREREGRYCVVHGLHNLQHVSTVVRLGKLEKDMDWAGKDGMAVDKVGVFAPETDVGDMLRGPVDATFHEFRQQLQAVNHFTYETKGGGFVGFAWRNHLTTLCCRVGQT